jgi:hypothetical protein
VTAASKVEAAPICNPAVELMPPAAIISRRNLYE